MTHIVKLLYGSDRRVPDRVLNLSSIKPLGAVNTLRNGLTAFWKLDETSGNRADSSGNGYTLTDNHTVTSAAGKIGNAASFDAANTEYLSTESDILGGQWSVGGWVKTSNTAATIFGVWNPTGDQRSVSMTGAGSVSWSSDGTSTNSGSFTSASFADGLWHHFVITYDGTAANIYKDATLVKSQAVTIYNSTARMYLARRQGSSVYMSGQLDAVGVWDRALSAAEAAALYNSGAGLEYPFYNAEDYGNITISAGGLVPNAGPLSVVYSGQSGRFDGQLAVNESRDNMTLELKYNIKGGSLADVMQLQRQISQFAREAKLHNQDGIGEPVWLEYRWNTRSDLDNLPRPTWGQLNYYAEVLSIDIKWPDDVQSNGYMVSGLIEGVLCTLTCKPHWVGLEQLCLNTPGAMDVTAQTNTSLNPVTLGSQYTVTGWHQQTASLSAINVCWRYYVDANNYLALHYDTTGAAVLTRYVSGSSTTITSAVLDSTPHHLVVVDNGLALALYVDGVAQASTLATNAWAAGTWYTGCWDASGTYIETTTSLDGLRVWTGDNLTAAEIAALYAEEYQAKLYGGWVGRPPYQYTYSANRKIHRGNSTDAGTGSTNCAIIGNVNGSGCEALARYKLDVAAYVKMDYWQVWVGRYAADISTMTYADFSKTLSLSVGGLKSTAADTASMDDEYYYGTKTSGTQYAKTDLVGRFKALARVSFENDAIAKFAIKSGAYDEWTLYEPVTVEAATGTYTFRLVDLGDAILARPKGYGNIRVGVDYTLDTSSDVGIDFLQLIPYPYVEITRVSGQTDDYILTLDGSLAIEYLSSANYETFDVMGPLDGVTLEPGKYNYLVFQFGTDRAEVDINNNYISLTTYITPRWTLPGGLVA